MRKTFRLYIAAFVLAATLPLAAQNAAPPQFMAALGGGNVKGKWIGKSMTFGGKYEMDLYNGGFLSKLGKSSGLPGQAMIGFKNYAFNYKIYSLFGEPVFDFQFFWDEPTHIYPSEKFNNSDKTGIVVPREIAQFPADLRAKIAKLRPVSVKFMIALTNQSYFKTLKYAKGNLVESFDARTDLGPEIQSGQYGVRGTHMIASSWSELKAYKQFSVDVPEIAGKWQTFSVPGSPNWKDLPPFFKKVFKDRRNADDLIVSDVTITEIQWPEYDIENIVSEYINRAVAERRKNDIAAADFWDKPVGKAELPVKTTSAPAPTAEQRQASKSAAEKASDEKYKSLDGISKAPASIEIVDLNKMKLALNPAFGAADLVLVDTAGKERARASVSAGGKAVDLAAVQGLSRIDVYRNGELVGSIPWSYLDASRGVVELTTAKGPYSVRVSFEGKEVFAADCRDGPKKHLFALPAGYSENRLPELLVTTSGFGSFVTSENRNMYVARREKEAADQRERERKAAEWRRKNPGKKPTAHYVFNTPRYDPSYNCVSVQVKIGAAVYSGTIGHGTDSGSDRSFSDFSNAKIGLAK